MLIDCLLLLLLLGSNPLLLLLHRLGFPVGTTVVRDFPWVGLVPLPFAIGPEEQAQGDEREDHPYWKEDETHRGGTFHIVLRVEDLVARKVAARVRVAAPAVIFAAPLKEFGRGLPAVRLLALRERGRRGFRAPPTEAGAGVGVRVFLAMEPVGVNVAH